jgi:hypothetical protein
MKIENFKKTNRGKFARVSAEVIWEDCPRQPQELYIETLAEYGDSIDCHPQAFLVGTAIAAMRYQEKRIAIDAEICPELKEGIETAMTWLCHWHRGDRRVIPIEAKIQSNVVGADIPKRSGLFFSGGIDALVAIKTNRLNFPSQHSGSIRDGLLVYGILNEQDEADPSFEIISNSVANLAQHFELNLIPVSTNLYAHIRDLDRDFWFWKLEYHGSFLAAIAHAFSSRFTTMSIASTYDAAHLDPWGSHPLLDFNYSSANLKIKHENVTLSRLTKTKLIADSQIVLNNLWVCNEVNQSYRVGQLNCGHCEKCVRTMGALLALGILDRTKVFPQQDLSEELLVRVAQITDSYEESCYVELREPLAKRGRHDLVRGIDRAIVRYRERDLRGVIKRFDRRFFNSNLQKIIRSREAMNNEQ